MLGKHLQLAASNGLVEGDAIFTVSSSATSPATYTWVCPPGVYSISMVLIGGGGAGHDSAAGGYGGTTSFNSIFLATGGNGSGGGGTWLVNPNNASLGRTLEGQGGIGLNGDANYPGGSGGQNGPGGSAAIYTNHGTSFGNIAAAFDQTPGGRGTNLYGGLNAYTGALNGGDYGGGGGAQVNPSYQGGGRLGAGGGGGLTYKNNYAVTPGQSYTVSVGNGGQSAYAGDGGTGAVRIVWPGDTRSFPSTNVS